MKAVVMAGGKGKRLNRGIEKPLIEIKGKNLLERTLDVLRSAGITDIVVAVTKWTPETKKKAEHLGIEVIETPGKGYVHDIQYLKQVFHEFLAVAVDLPCLRPGVLKTVLQRYAEVHRSIAVVTPVKEYERMGFVPSIVDHGFVPVGVNIVSHGDDDDLVVIHGSQTMNINTIDELEKVKS